MSARSALVRQLSCVCCDIEDVQQPFPTQEHHCNAFGLAGKKRLGDDQSVALCAYHHVGTLLPGISREDMAHKYGPSLALNKKLFRFTYGDDSALIAATNHKLAQLLPATA